MGPLRCKKKDTPIRQSGDQRKLIKQSTTYTKDKENRTGAALTGADNFNHETAHSSHRTQIQNNHSRENCYLIARKGVGFTNSLQTIGAKRLE
jgi:hypothetical protein